MQHPFEGIMAAGHERLEAKPTRRGMLGRMLWSLAALFGAATVSSAETRRRPPTTLALGEEGGWRPPRRRRVTTYAVGEEGGPVTTYALGEEGASWPPPYGPVAPVPPIVPSPPAGSLPPLPELPPLPKLPPLPGTPTT
jgi:hypothetical protein